MNKQDKWLSVSEFASLLGVSSQTIYNRIARGSYETQEFRRGKMRGILVRVPKNVEYETE